MATTTIEVNLTTRRIGAEEAVEAEVEEAEAVETGAEVVETEAVASSQKAKITVINLKRDKFLMNIFMVNVSKISREFI